MDMVGMDSTRNFHFCLSLGSLQCALVSACQPISTDCLCCTSAVHGTLVRELVRIDIQPRTSASGGAQELEGFACHWQA